MFGSGFDKTILDHKPFTSLFAVIMVLPLSSFKITLCAMGGSCVSGRICIAKLLKRPLYFLIKLAHQCFDLPLCLQTSVCRHEQDRKQAPSNFVRSCQRILMKILSRTKIYKLIFNTNYFCLNYYGNKIENIEPVYAYYVLDICLYIGFREKSMRIEQFIMRTEIFSEFCACMINPKWASLSN